MKRSLFIFVLLILSTSVYSQINFKGYVIGKEIPQNKVSTTKMSFAGQYGHFEASENSNGVIHSIVFKPQKSGTPTLLTKTEVQKFINSLKHYFRVEMQRESQGKSGVFKGKHNNCNFVLNYNHQQFNNGSYYLIDLVIHNPKLGSI